MSKLPARFLIQSLDPRLSPLDDLPDWIQIQTDSRAVRPGDLFWPFIGDRFDAHRFIPEAIERGATVIVSAQNNPVPPGVHEIRVDDTLAAYQRLAEAWMRRWRYHGGISFGISGSAGKTTLKAILAAVLGPQTLATEANENNRFGVPKTILNLTDHHRMAVIEAGLGGPNEMARYSRLIQPDVAALTTIAPAHIEFFRDMAHLAREKGLLFSNVSLAGRAIYGGPPEFLEIVQQMASVPVTWLNPAAEAWTLSDGTVVDELWRSHERSPFPLAGKHNLHNLALALEVALSVGISPESARSRLNQIDLPPMRYERRNGPVTLILDCYNANLASMLAGIDTFNSEPTQGRRVAIVGPIAEVGDHSEAQHRQVAEALAEAVGLSEIILVGSPAPAMAQTLADRGRHAEVLADPADLPKWLKHGVKPGDIVWAKASRASAFEKHLIPWHQEIQAESGN